MSVYRTIGPLVLILKNCPKVHFLMLWPIYKHDICTAHKTFNDTFVLLIFFPAVVQYAGTARPQKR